MAYSSDTNEKIVNFINRAQTRIGQSSIVIAKKVNKNSRRESFQDVSDEAFLLDAFIRALDNTFNNWTEDEIVQCIEFWNARARLNEVPYFSHQQYNYNIVINTNNTFVPDSNLNMLGFKITGLGSGTSNSDAVNRGQLNTRVAKAGDTMSGNLAMSNHKVTGLAAATVAGDAVSLEQLPTSLPPSGPAGGDLGGSFPNPTVNDDSHIHTPGTTIPAYPTTLPPSGPAGGALTGSYPNPELSEERLKLSGGTMGGIIDLGGFRIINSGGPINPDDLVRLVDLFGRLPLSGGSMSGNIDMGFNKIISLASGTDPNDAVRYDQLQLADSFTTTGIVFETGFIGSTYFGFRLTGTDMVDMVGYIVGPGGSLTQGQLCFTMPVGYRPPDDIWIVVGYFGVPNGSVLQLNIQANGQAYIYQSGAGGTTSIANFSVEGIRFRI